MKELDLYELNKLEEVCCRIATIRGYTTQCVLDSGRTVVSGTIIGNYFDKQYTNMRIVLGFTRGKSNNIPYVQFHDGSSIQVRTLEKHVGKRYIINPIARNQMTYNTVMEFIGEDTKVNPCAEIAQPGIDHEKIAKLRKESAEKLEETRQKTKKEAYMLMYGGNLAEMPREYIDAITSGKLVGVSTSIGLNDTHTGRIVVNDPFADVISYAMAADFDKIEEKAMSDMNAKASNHVALKGAVVKEQTKVLGVVIEDASDEHLMQLVRELNHQIQELEALNAESNRINRRIQDLEVGIEAVVDELDSREG